MLAESVRPLTHGSAGACNLDPAQYRHVPVPLRLVQVRMLCLAGLGCGCPPSGTDTNGPHQGEDPPVGSVGTIPNGQTPAAALSTATLQHTELVRITRNFGKSNFEIALDAWTPIENPREIADVRLWWAMSDRDGERGPFSAKSRDHFQMTYERLAPDRWRVDLGSDRHVYRFWIEYDETGVVAAFADVVGDAGESFEHCRVTRGTLAARKIFGAPVGIRDFEVTCIDAEGSQRSGNMIDSAE